MQKKLLSILCMFCLIFSFNSTVNAAEDEKDVEPNIYEKRDIYIKKSNRGNLLEREELPEEQLGLTFDRDERTESEQLLDELFESSVVETNTITSKAAQMELFSVSDEPLKRDKETEVEQESTSFLTMFMIIAVIVVIGLLIIIMPRLQHTQD